MPEFLPILLFYIFPAVMLASAIFDALTMTIPNRLNAILVLSFAFIAPVAGLPLVAMGWHALAGLLVLAVCFAFFAFGWMGGGDAKMAAGIGLWFGFSVLMEWAILTALFGGVLTIALVLLRKFPLPVKLQEVCWIARLHSQASGIPYGIALAAGAILVYAQSPVASALQPA